MTEYILTINLKVKLYFPLKYLYKVISKNIILTEIKLNWIKIKAQDAEPN